MSRKLNALQKSLLWLMDYFTHLEDIRIRISMSTDFNNFLNLICNIFISNLIINVILIFSIGLMSVNFEFLFRVVFILKHIY